MHLLDTTLIKMMFLLPLLALPALVRAQTPTAVPCASFWPGVTGEDIDPDVGNADCYVYPGTPEVIGSVNVTFAYDVAWAQQPDTVAIVDGLGLLLHNAMLTTVPAFEQLQNNVPDIVFILTTLSFGDEQAGTHRPVLDGPCRIRLSSGWWELPGAREDARRMQTLAHEVYHCVQSDFWSRDDFDYKPDNWLRESSAEYFSNIAFPNVNDEWGTAAAFRQEIALFDNDIYSANIFLQSMENSYSPTYINNWVRQSAVTSNTGEERARLAGLGGFADDFHSFGRQFTGPGIRDTSGVMLPTFPQVVDPVAFVPSADGTTATLSLTPTTFTANVYSFTLDGGQTASLVYSSTSPNVRVAYKLASGSDWLDMPGGNNPSSSDGKLAVPCSSEDQSVSSVSALLLVTSTDDTATVDVQVVVNKESDDDECLCPSTPGGGGGGGAPNNRRRGLERCPPSTCVAVPSQPASDPCLEGKTWRLNNAAIEELMRAKLGDLGAGAVISNLGVTGSGLFTIAGTNASFTYENYGIDMTITFPDLEWSLPTHTVINGAFDSNFYVQATGVFCLDVYAGQGRAVETDSVTGGFSFDLGPQGGFVEQGYRINYVCQPGSLTMQMNSGDKSWGPYVYSS